MSEECRPIEMPQVQPVNGRLRAVADPELHSMDGRYDMVMPTAGRLYHCCAEEPASINIVVPLERDFADPDYEERSLYVKLMAVDGYDPSTGAVTGFGEMVVRYAMPDPESASTSILQGQREAR